MRHAIIPLVTIVVVLLATQSNAQWQADGHPLVVAPFSQSAPVAVADGAGGAIGAWVDLRSGAAEIYAQRIDAHGIPQWQTNGVRATTTPNVPFNLVMTSDGSGGVIMAWDDFIATVANIQIYAQRIDASGSVLWSANGVAISTAAKNQETPTIVSDGAGGAIISWADNRGLTLYDIFSQRVNGLGAPLWTANGVELAKGALEQITPTSAPDGLGGAFVTWSDTRNGVYDVYARNISAGGTPMGTSGGRAICTAVGEQFQPVIAKTTVFESEAIIVWLDNRTTTSSIYAQRIVGGSSAPQWTTDGVPIATLSDAGAPAIISDGQDGAVIAWQDDRNLTNDIYAQRISRTGAAFWTNLGHAVCTAGNDQLNPLLVPDGTGGAIVLWEDKRNAFAGDVYTQRVDGFGNAWWSADGTPLTQALGSQNRIAAVSDGAGNAIAAWADSRSGPDDIYAQRVETRYGYWGHPEPSVYSVEDVAGDQGGSVTTRWLASERDQVLNPIISHYSVWRSLDAAQVATLGRERHIADPRAIVSEFSGRAIWEETTAAGSVFWEWMLNQSAAYQPSYSATIATLADSTGAGPATHYFKILAHESVSNPSKIWESNVGAGSSIDNLAPPAPIALMATRVGADVHLNWTGVAIPDLREYTIYRATLSGVQPIPPNFLATAQNPAAIDANAPPTILYYVVTAIDNHDNESDPSNEASVFTPTGIGDLPPVTALTVRQNFPNPFAGTTSLRIGVPDQSDVAIEIFDVTGRLVGSRTIKDVSGWRDVTIAASDFGGQTLASGVYFYRVSVGTQTIQSKMVITR